MIQAGAVLAHDSIGADTLGDEVAAMDLDVD
jgi:hypothetical protein